VSWCDKLASTPGVGFKLDPDFIPSAALLAAFNPIFKRWVQEGSDTVEINKQETFDIEFTSKDGYRYGADHSRIHVTFHHKLAARTVSAGPPIMEMLSKPLPYSTLLGEAGRRLVEATLLLPNRKERRLTRVGVISNTSVSLDEAPPGIKRFITYLGRPWGDLPEYYQIRINSRIGTPSSRWTDRCIHMLQKEEGPDDLIVLKFDWQRYFSEGRVIGQDSLHNILMEAEEASTEYFEDLAEGSRFDELIIGSS
jgi:hypothetical protein